jgi:hypothetical protein
MEYTVVTSRTITDLIDIVNRYIKLGYKPQGGIGSDSMLWSQAMVKEKN